MIPILVALWTVNYRVYGAHKLWNAPAGRATRSAVTRSPG
jgi:hypothetical protein